MKKTPFFNHINGIFVLWIIIFLAISLNSPSLAYAQEYNAQEETYPANPAADETDGTDEQFCSVFADGYNLLYFYSRTCAHCRDVEDSGILEKIEKEFDMSIWKVTGDEMDLILQLCNYVDDKEFMCGAVPTLFIVHHNSSKHLDLEVTAIQGDKPIIEDSIKIISSVSFDKPDENEICEPDSFWKALGIIVTLGLSDSINPCIMSILALLLMQISVISTRKRIIKLGSVFILSVFLSYTIIGVLILFVSRIFIMNVTNTLAATLGVIVMWLIVALLFIAGLINIKDFFWYGKGITFKIPKKYLGTVDSLVKQLSIPSILVLALLITLIEFPCSGIMYLGAVGYLTTQFSNMAIIMFFMILYNLLFVLPLIIMTGLAYYGTDPERLDKFRIKFRALFRLIMGIVLVGMAIYLIYNQGLI